MAVENWYLKNLTVSGANRLFWDKDPISNVAGATQANFGWIVGKTAATRYAYMSNNGTEVSTFGTGVLPDSTAPTGDVNAAGPSPYSPPNLTLSTDSISTLYPYNGYFPSGTWTFAFQVQSTTAAASGSGRIDIRVFKATDNNGNWGTVQELTSAVLTGTTVSNLLTTTPQTSTCTWSAPIVRLDYEYLIIKVVWVLTVASGANGADINFRTGNTSKMTSPTFVSREYNIT